MKAAKRFSHRRSGVIYNIGDDIDTSSWTEEEVDRARAGGYLNEKSSSKTSSDDKSSSKKSS